MVSDAQSTAKHRSLNLSRIFSATLCPPLVDYQKVSQTMTCISEDIYTRACLSYRSIVNAERTLQGVKAANRMRKGQVKRLERSDAMGQAKFVESLSG
jgi:hypothetical protein